MIDRRKRREIDRETVERKRQKDRRRIYREGKINRGIAEGRL